MGADQSKIQDKLASGRAHLRSAAGSVANRKAGAGRNSKGSSSASSGDRDPAANNKVVVSHASDLGSSSVAPPSSATTTTTTTKDKEGGDTAKGKHHHQQQENKNDMPSSSSTVPCQYRTGKTLGSGTYAIVKEAIHIKTGKYYACKVINKKLMEGREYMVRNEIAVLKRVSKGHPNIVTLHDYFETTHNLYLCFDLCTGGELFDRICAKGNYYEHEAANLVRTVLGAVQYIHDCGIVHRDLKPENLLFRTKESANKENADKEAEDVMIADFGLSRIMEEEKLQMLTEICGTPGYMAPEIFKKTGHSKPVDIWAIGVITYFLLCGYTPFDRDTQELEMQAIIAGDYKFEPEEYWCNVSPTARSFVSTCLTIDPVSRPTASEALQHPWLASKEPHFVKDSSGVAVDLLPGVQKGFNARKTFRKAVLGMMAMKRMSMLSAQHPSALNPAARQLADSLYQYKEDSEREELFADKSLVHHHGLDPSLSEDDIAALAKNGKQAQAPMAVVGDHLTAPPHSPSAHAQQQQVEKPDVERKAEMVAPKKDDSKQPEALAKELEGIKIVDSAEVKKGDV
ncbi:Pkinase-domain-containing protein [Rickenella mellea]|uniref:Pkinase-domain-containing protein n=1 Tax=Rickenella mellea TaxID=50990 RepID=A0A4Y7QKH0_9AGAM|nr:Pkinase-domain-containing protein [Rickenella mellea]